MNRLWELLLGLEAGFLSREGDFTVTFHPDWPWQGLLGAGLWNGALAVLSLWLIVVLYRSEQRPRAVAMTLAAFRIALLLLILAMLNRPVLTLGQVRTQPSVLAVMVDRSASMSIRDVGAPDAPAERLEAALSTLRRPDVLDELRKVHDVKLYEFASVPTPVSGPDALAALKPEGPRTQLISSITSVLDDLRGQRVAGVVVLTDGRETPTSADARTVRRLQERGVRVFPVPVGSDLPIRNVEIVGVSTQESAFLNDLVNVKVTVRSAGAGAGEEVEVHLLDQATGLPLVDADGNPPVAKVRVDDSGRGEVELQFKPGVVGPLNMLVKASSEAGEIDEQDNSREVPLIVLDARIAVLYVDGYPRWDYRYLKNELIRDPTVDLSCLLTSADPGFRQEGDRPITRFPESMEELLEYDVVIFGDVDPRQFSDRQLQLVAEFVSEKGGGFGMVAGPIWSPHSWRGTPIEAVLPVQLSGPIDAAAYEASSTGFRPQLTRDGQSSSIFRFFADRAQNESYLRNNSPLMFWYSRGVTAKPGLGVVLAEHPSESAPDGRRAPLLVSGRFGAGRTMFSALDDSWRWRFYTGESIFDTYWVQQLRHLARSRKLGQRRATLISERPVYEVGEQARVLLRVLDATMVRQFPEEIPVELRAQDGTLLREFRLTRSEGEPELFAGSFTVEQTGRFRFRAPQLPGGLDSMETPVEVRSPRLEFESPAVDAGLLHTLAQETRGEVVPISQAADRLKALLPSAARTIPIETVRPLWNAPFVLALFTLLITLEWIGRKRFGMV
jgi:hypothetical protein